MIPEDYGKWIHDGKMFPEGYWTSIGLDGKIFRLFKVDDRFDTYRYDRGEWVKLDRMPKFGWEIDYDYISEEEAMEIINKMKSEQEKNEE